MGVTTKVIDLKGQRLVPGFYDSHLHFLGGGLSLARVDLKDAKDEAEFGKRLVAFDKNTSREPLDRRRVVGPRPHVQGRTAHGRDRR